MTGGYQPSAIVVRQAHAGYRRTALQISASNERVAILKSDRLLDPMLVI